MCRWLICASHDPICLGDVVLRPKNSLVHQSFSAEIHPGFTSQNNATLNADGVGVAWYKGDKPYLYKGTEPAWCDANLLELASYVESPVICGHVRAASPGSVVNRENCHPFRFGRLIFQHNGHIEGFKVLKRKMQGLMTDQAFNNIDGGTDSEQLFALIISNLRDASRTSPFPLEELQHAVSTAFGQVMELLEQAGVTGGFTTMNTTLTDGVSVICTRFCDKFPAIPPPSLYFCYERVSVLKPLLEAASANAGPGDGSDRKDEPETGAQGRGARPTEADYEVTHQMWKETDESLIEASRDPAWRMLIVASDPLTTSPDVRWHRMPAQSMLCHQRGTELTDHRSRPQVAPFVCGQPIALPAEGGASSKRQRTD